MKIRFSPTGRIQFLATIAHIQQDNPTAAKRFRQKTEQKLRRLESFPESGRQVPEFPDLPYREVIVAPYRLFYRVDLKTVWIVAVWHGAQIPMSPDT